MGAGMKGSSVAILQGWETQSETRESQSWLGIPGSAMRLDSGILRLLGIQELLGVEEEHRIELCFHGERV